MSKTVAARCRLRSHKDFATVYGSRQSVRNRHLTACFTDSGLAFSRLGLSVGRRVGNAVCRNRVKRILREVFRQEGHLIALPLDIILIPRSYLTGRNLEEMTGSFQHLVRKLNRLHADEPSS